MPEKLLPTLFTIALILVLFALVWWGWRSRLRRQSDVPEPPRMPADALESVVARADGMYVVTTYEGQPLERIAAHGLGFRSKAEAVVTVTGVLLNRQGAQDVFIPRERLRSVSTTSGMVGKFVERDGLVVFTWQLGDLAVDTGFRARSAEESRAVETAAAALVPA